MSKTITRKYIQRITKREGNTNIRQISGGGGGGGGGASQYWVEENYISKLFFNQLFTVYDEDGNVVEPNDTESVIASIKAMFGFWTDAYLSALGNGEGGGAELTLASLADVDVHGVANGQALVYDATTQKWVPGQGGGIDITAMWAALAQSGVQQIDASHLATALTGYATETWVGNQGYITGSALNGYATESWVGSQISDMATQTWVSGNYLSQTNAAATYLTQTNAAATYLTKTDAATTYVSIAFFERLFKAYNGSTVVHPNNTTSTIDNIKAMFGFWTDFYLSALGNGSGGSTPGVTMAQVWSALGNSTTEQINISHLTTALSGYNPTSNFKTINGNSIIGTGDIVIQGGGGTGTVTAVKVGTTTYSPTDGVVSLPAYPSAVSQLTNDSGYITKGNLSVWNNAPMSWGTLKSTNGYTVGINAKSPDDGGWVIAYKDGQISIQLDGYFYQNEGRYRVLDTSDASSLSVNFATNSTYATYATLLTPNSNASSYRGSTWGVPAFSSYKQIWGESFKNTSISNDTGDVVFALRNSTYSSSGCELCIAIDGDYYAGSGQYKVWHAGNFTPSDYLPLTGGTLTANNASLTLQSTSQQSWLIFNNTVSGVEKTAATVGYYHNFAYISNEASSSTIYARIGVTDDGTPQYWPNNNGSTAYTLIHAGNIGSQSVASASALTTARSLWGNSFDGSADISGSLHIFSTGSSFNEGIRMHVASNRWCGLVMCGIDNTGASGTSAKTWSIHNNDGKFIIAQNGSDSFTNGIRCVSGTWHILSSGNVGIGTTSPSYKLHVAGTFYASGNSSIGGTFDVTGATTLSSSLSVSGNSTLSGYVGVGTAASSSYALKVSGVAYASTGFYSGGYVTALSDARHKDVKGDVGLTVSEVANAPSVKFLWKDRRHEGLQVGSIAQYWQQVMPEAIVKNSDGELTMSYGVIALLASIATARKVEDHERRIRELEEENKKLKQQLNAA